MKKVAIIHSSGDRYGPCEVSDLLIFIIKRLGFRIEEVDEPILVTREMIKSAVDAWGSSPNTYGREQAVEFFYQELKKAAK